MSNKNIRILELCLSPAYGGLELHVRDFCVWLSGQQDTDLYLVLKNDSPIHRDLKRINIPIHLYNKTAGKLPLLTALDLARYIDTNRIDIVHMHWKDDLPLAALAKRLSKRNPALVVSRHMLLPHKKHDPYHRFIYRPVNRYITITEDLKRQAVKNLPIREGKIEVIYYGVKVPERITLTQSGRIKHEFNIDDRYTVGLVGRICPEKRQLMFIQAVENLHKEEIPVHGLIIGSVTDPGYDQEIRRYVQEKDLEDAVSFSGFYDRPTDLMQCLDVLVMPSGVETFGLVLIEAMHCGIPVIGSNKGGVPEIIDHGVTGLMYETDDVQAFSTAMARMYHDKTLRRRLAENGQTKAREMFVDDIQYSKVKKALLNCIESGA
jgi:glycosyltransferase involved in cell wall biosynthesis